MKTIDRINGTTQNSQKEVRTDKQTGLGSEKMHDYKKAQEEFEKKIDDQNHRVFGLIVNITVSMITTIIIFYLLTKAAPL